MSITMPTSVDRLMTAVKVTPDQIAQHLLTLYTQAKVARREIEPEWREVDSIYADPVYTSKGSNSYANNRTGDTGQWRHRINTAKTFEVVETLVAYFTNATFPNADWFDVKANTHGIGEVVPIIKELLKQELEYCGVRVAVEDWMRNLVKYGTSTYRVAYDKQLTTTRTKEVVDSSLLEVTCESPYDVWFDPHSPVHKAATFCRIYPSKADLLHMISSGYLTLDDNAVEKYNDGKRSTTDNDNDTSNDVLFTETITEFYGRVTIDGVVFDRVHAVFYGQRLCRLANSSHSCGSPFVTATMLPRRESHYGMSCLNPALGILHTLNTLTNSRLDNMALYVNRMFEMVDDGVLEEERVFTEPGKVFKVASKGNISPIDLGTANFTVTYQEQQLQQSSIDSALSVGPLVGSGQPRSGERVTAREVTAVQDSGGNRLSAVHNRVETLGTVPMLNKCLAVLQQYVDLPKVIAVYDTAQKQQAYYKVKPEHLRSDVRLVATGATFVVEKERIVGELINLLDVAARSPQLDARINYDAVLEDIMRQMRFQDPKRYLKPVAQAQPSAPPPDPTATLGGDMSAAAYQQSLLSDGGEAMATAMGLPTDGVPPEQLQQVMTELSPFTTQEQSNGTTTGIEATTPTV